MCIGIQLSCQLLLTRSAANRTFPRCSYTGSARLKLSVAPLAILFALSLAACSNSSSNEESNEINREMPIETAVDGVNGPVSGELLIRTFEVPGANTQPFRIDLTSGKASAAIPASVTDVVDASTPHSINEVGSDSTGVRTLLRQSQLPNSPSLVVAEPPGELTPDELSDRFNFFSIVWQPAQ